jgi:hypothetical protein
VFRSRLQGEVLALVLADPGIEWTVDDLAGRTGQPYQTAVMSFGPPLVVGEEFGSLAGVSQVFIYGSWAARYGGESGPAPATWTCC